MGEPWTEVLHSQRAKKSGSPERRQLFRPELDHLLCVTPLHQHFVRYKNNIAISSQQLFGPRVMQLGPQSCFATRVGIGRKHRTHKVSWACSVCAYSRGLARRPSGRPQGWRFLPQVATLMRLTRMLAPAYKRRTLLRRRLGPQTLALCNGNLKRGRENAY